MDNLLKKAMMAAQEAGAEIMKQYASPAFTTKTDGSPVTLADTGANSILISHLTPTGIDILSEESGLIPTPYPSRLWVLDPLDGTKDFIHKTGEFSVMIGLLEYGRPILSVMYVPVDGTMYYALKGAGAFVIKNGVTKKLIVSDREKNDLRYIRSVNNFTPEMEHVAQSLSATLHPHGSIGIKAGLMGEDYGDFFFYSGKLGEWDVCAPELLVTEAGGTVTDLENNLLEYGTSDHRIQKGVLFSNGVCHARVLQAILDT